MVETRLNSYTIWLIYLLLCALAVISSVTGQLRITSACNMTVSELKKFLTQHLNSIIEIKEDSKIDFFLLNAWFSTPNFRFGV